MLYESKHITSSYFSSLFLKELGVDLLADDLGADVIFHSNAKPHLFKYKLHFLLFFHGAICLNLSMRERIEVENSISNRTTCQFGPYKIANYCSCLEKYLQLLKDGRCLVDISTLLLDIGQGLRQPCTLNLHIDL